MKRSVLFFWLILAAPLPTLAQQAGTFHTFPQIADGQAGDGTRYTTTFVVTNINDGRTACTLSFGGLSLSRLAGTPGSFSLTDRGSIAILETRGSDPLDSGYATLSCDADVTAQALYQLHSSQGLLGMATVFSSPARSAASLPLCLEDGGHRLGIALANDGDTDISVNIAILDMTSNTVGTGTVSIPARSSVARFIDEVASIPLRARGQFYGSALLSSVSGKPFSTIGLLYVGLVFTTVPATEMPWEAKEAATVTLGASPTYGGTTNGDGSYPVGSVITISAIPKQGWIFSRWSDGISDSQRAVAVISGGLTLTAYFQPGSNPVVHESDELYDNIKGVLNAEGVTAAVEYIKSMVRIGDSVHRSSGELLPIIDVDIKANGSWVVGDGMGPQHYTAFFWYNSSNTRVLELYMGTT